MVEATSPPRPRRSWMWVGAFVMVPVLVAGLVLVITRRSGPPALAPALLQVRLEGPTAAAVGQTVPVVVAAIGPDSLTRIEVWAGGDLVAADEPAVPGTALLTELPWLVATATRTTLVARAFDAGGRVGLSNTISVAVSPGLELVVVDDGGHTLGGLAGDHSGLASALNGGIDPTVPLAAGAPVLLPVLEIDDAPGAPPGPAQGLGLAATASGCEVSAAVSGLTDPGQRPDGWSVELHRHLAGGAGSVVAGVMTDAGIEAGFTDAPGAGTHLYSAVEHAGDVAVSRLVSVMVDACQGSDGITVEQGVLYLGSPVDGVFVYLSQGGASIRVPDDPAELVTGDGLTFDLRPFLPPMPTTDVAVEVWGRSGGAVNLLGSLVLDPDALQSPQTGLHALMDLSLFPEPVPATHLSAFSNDTIQFAWASTVEHSGVRWFLARTKPGPATVLSPVGVAQSGLAAVDADDHRFSIDLSANQVPSVVPLTLDQVKGDMAFAGLPVGLGGPSRSLRVHADAPGTTWVWAIPVDPGGNPVGPPSNLVQLVIEPAPYDPTLAPPYDVVGIDVTVPPAANPALRGCVRIVSESPRWPIFLNGLGVFLDGSAVPTGGSTIKGSLPYTKDQTGRAIYPFTVCPGELTTFESGGGAGGNPLNEFGQTLAGGVEGGFELLSGVVNWASETYQEIKATVISAVADVVCPSEFKSECKTMIEIGVDIMLTSVGIPPTLPSFDDLATAAKGELVDLALDQLGVSEACDAVSESVTGKTCGQVAAALADQDACALVPESQHDQCENYVAAAQKLCAASSLDPPGCEIATLNARDLVEQGMNTAYDLAVEETKKQVTDALYAALYGVPASSLSMFGYGDPQAHGCAWGGPAGETVVCPSVPFLGVTPPGCHFDSWYDKVVCTKPPPKRVAVAEPRGVHQPIRVDVTIRRNGNPLPADFHCGPISAVATTVTPYGAVGQPYLAAASVSDVTYDYSFDAGWVQDRTFTVYLHEPNPSVHIAPENMPPGSDLDDLLGDVLNAALGDLGNVIQSSAWESLLVPDSVVGVKVWGDCVGEAYAGEEPLHVAAVVPPPLPRITPGES